ASAARAAMAATAQTRPGANLRSRCILMVVVLLVSRGVFIPGQYSRILSLAIGFSKSVALQQLLVGRGEIRLILGPGDIAGFAGGLDGFVKLSVLRIRRREGADEERLDAPREFASAGGEADGRGAIPDR